VSDTDQEIFDSAIDPTPPEPVESAPQEATPSERVRDEKGRFAAKAETTPEQSVSPSVETPAPTETPEDAKIPSWRLKEESDRRRDAERALEELRNEFRNVQMQMAQFRQPQMPMESQERPDIFADPEGFVQTLQGQFEQRIRAIQLENSLKFAHREYGEKFNEAYNNFTDYITKTRDQATYQRIMASHDPGESLVQWYKDQQLHQELGGSDLKSFLEKQREEWLKDPTVQAKVIEAFKATQQAQSPNNINLPPSLSKAPSSASAHDDGGSSAQDIYNYATRR
jgi:hypothetical protein